MNKKQTMSKFKVGDIIRANKASNSEYWITNQKNAWTGKVLAIKEAYIRVITLSPETHKGETFEVKEAYFYKAENRQIITHIVKKNIVKIKLDDGKTGIAKCSPDDKFNIAFGTALAVARAYGDKETEAKLLAEPAGDIPQI